MGKYRTLGVDLDRTYRNDLNANFNDVDTDVKAVQTNVDTQKDRVDDLIVGTPQPSEVVDSRGGFPVLRDRLDGVDTQLAQTATKATNPFKYGLIGNGTTDDSAAIASAFNAMISSGSKTLILPDVPIRIAQTVTLNFQGGSGYRIICLGIIKPDIGIKEVFRAINGKNIDISLIADGGGQFLTTPSTNHSTFAKDATGIDTLIYIRGISGMILNLNTNNFKGRGFEIDSAITGEPATDKMNFGSIVLNNVGQSCCVKTGVGTGSLGKIFCSEHSGFYIKAHDISLLYYENYMWAEAGACKFFDSSSIHIGKILIGDQGSELIGFDTCYRITIDEGFVRGRALKDIPNQIGLAFRNCTQVNAKINSMSMTGAVVYCSYVRNGNIEILDDGSSDNAFHVDTERGYNENLTVNAIATGGIGKVSIHSSNIDTPNTNITVRGAIKQFVVDGYKNEITMDRLKTVQNTSIVSGTTPSQNNIIALSCKTTYLNEQPKETIKGVTDRPKRVQTVQSGWANFTVVLDSAQADTSYYPFISPSWNAGNVWITGKTTAQFVVNWATAPTATETFLWEVTRV